MPTPTTNGTQLAHLERLCAAYRNLPVEAIVKEDVLTAGVSVPAGMTAPRVAALKGGPFELRQTIACIHPVESAPYRLEQLETGLALSDTSSGELVVDLRPYPRRPGYAALAFPDGSAYSAVLDERAVVRLPLASPRAPDQLAEAAAETFLFERWQSGESPLCIRVVPDNAVLHLTEADQDAFLLPYVRALFERVGRMRPLMLYLPPRSQESEQQLFEAGVSGRVSVMEVWDRELFETLGPRVGLDWDTWIERLTIQPYIYLEHFAQPVLLVGKEMSQPGGFAELGAAFRSTQQGIKFLLDHRALVRLMHWHPPERVARELEPPVEYFLDLDQFWYETWVKDYREELGGELVGPGRARNPESAFLDVGRGAALQARGDSHDKR